VGLEQVVGDDRHDNDPSQGGNPGGEKVGDTYNKADYGQDHSDNPDPGPGHETTNPEYDIDDPDNCKDNSKCNSVGSKGNATDGSNA
jgi:hypothetical protein